MPGPPPKDSRIRQRRNKAPTRAGMVTEQPARKRAPHLPRLPEGEEWHRLTRAWWKDVWASPMAEEYLDADLHGLYILAELVDRYWREPSKELAAEIRLQRQCFGLTPVDRRRLQWEVQRVEPDSRRGMEVPPRQGRLLEAEGAGTAGRREDGERREEDPRKILQFRVEGSG